MSLFKQAVDTVTDISKKLTLFIPVTTKSINWKYWMATLDWKPANLAATSTESISHPEIRTSKSATTPQLSMQHYSHASS